MQRKKNKLTDVEVRQAKPGPKIRTISDGAGLFIRVYPNGIKRWFFRFWIGGIESSLTFGTYPEVSLSEARAERDKARGQLAQGIDPAAERRERRQEAIQARIERREAARPPFTFKDCTLEWFEKDYSLTVSEKTHLDTLYRVRRDLFPLLGKIPMSELSIDDVRSALVVVRDRGAIEQAARHLQLVARICRYARAAGYIQHDPCSDLQGFIPKRKTEGFRAIVDPRELGRLLLAIDGYHGRHSTRMALRLAPLIFIRPGEVRHLRWQFFDRKASMLRIPGDGMKVKGAEHLVPLSTQSLAILDAMHPFSGGGEFIFPGQDPAKPLSENTLNKAIDRLGFDSTSHGFKKSASTLLNENGWNRDAIEAQLAHLERNTIRATYNYAEYLEERVKMMQWWADYVDQLKEEARGTP